jgi:hypothetical protein
MAYCLGVAMTWKIPKFKIPAIADHTARFDPLKQQNPQVIFR